jgi:PAS domain S-box-containing protein
VIHAERIKPRKKGGRAGAVSAPDFHLLFEALPDPCMVLDRDLRIVAVSDSYLETTMTARGDILGRQLLEVFPGNPEDPTATGASSLSASLNRVLKYKVCDTMAVQKYDIRIPEPEGGGFQERYWSATNSPVFGADGEVDYLIHRVQDVTGFALLNRETVAERKMTEEFRERIESEIFAHSQKVAQTNLELQRAVEALHESERLFNSFMAQLPAAAWIKDLQGRYVFANAAMERLFDRRIGEMLGKTGEEVFPNLMARQFRESDQRVIEEGVSSEPFQVVRQAGEGERYLMITKFPIPGPDGGAEFVAGLAFDVTETRRLQAEIERVASFPLLDPQPVLELDREGTVTFINPAATELMRKGCYRDDNNPLIPEDFKELFERGASGGETQYFREIEICGRFYEELVTMLPQQGKVRCYTMDITKRKRAEHEREQLLLQLEAVLESINEGVVIADLDGNILTMNREALALHEFQSVEEVRRHVSAFPECYELSELQGRTLLFNDWPMMRALRGERFFDYELRLHNKQTGSSWIANYSGSPVLNKDGDVILAVLTLRDITHRKEMEEQVKKLNADLASRVVELQEANEELEAFNRMVSHDLRNPLNTIGTSCQAVQMLCGEAIGKDCSNYVNIAYDKVLMMNGLIEALLKFSRSTHSELKRETVDLSEMAQNVVTEVTLADPARRGVFNIAHGVSAYGDPDLLRSVLENLIGNAWKYTGNREEAVIDFGVIEVGGIEAYFVRDNGYGFDPAEAVHLFTPFKRLSGAERFRGFGIGLATVERIVRRHGGRVWADGRPGKGATFYFTVPTEGVADAVTARQPA